MSKGTYSPNKRARENDKARKKRDKSERRWAKRERGAGQIPVTTQQEMLGNMPTTDEAMLAIERRRDEPRVAAAIPSRLFVGGLSRTTTMEGLKAAFETLGPVIDAVVVMDRDTGESRGFGFVTMQNRRDAKRAIEALTDTDLDGRSIVVNTATDR